MTPPRPFVDAWARRTPREQRLALAVAGLCVLFAAAAAARAAYATIDRLDSEIARMQSDIVNYSHQIARKRQVEARFAQVASQHSSAWSESEIRDRLRQEIYRLSNLEPPALDANGIPLSTNSESGALVSIPELGRGRLIQGEDGFREYQIEFSVPPVPLLDLTAYLERLMESPQSLRVDRIDMRRDPGRPEVSANLVISRIVVDNPAGEGAGPLTASIAAPLALDPGDWTCEGCSITVAGQPGDTPVLEAAGAGEGGRLFMERMLPASAVFDVEAEVSSSAPGSIGVQAGGALLRSAGDTALRGDGAFYRYRFQFAVPREGGRVAVGFPVVAWTGKDAAIRIRNLRVAHAGETGDGA